MHQLLLWVSVATVFQGVSDVDLSSVNSLCTAVLPVGDFHRCDSVRLQQVNPPPGVGLGLGVCTGAFLEHTTSVAINGIPGSSGTVEC